MLVLTYTEETEPCPDAETTRTKCTYSHSWQEIYDALANGTPVYYNFAVETNGMVGTALVPIDAAVTDNVSTYMVTLLRAEGDLPSFPNATDKVWYVGECGK